MGYFRTWGFVFCILLLVIISQSTIKVEGQTVCSKTVRFSETYRQSYQVSYRKRSTYKCGVWNLGRCTRYRTVYKTNYRTATRISYRKQYQCCKGWSLVGDQCTKAICTQTCVNGICTRPDYCSCDPGYHGHRCDKGCPSNKWGPHCRHDCLCQNDANCSPYNSTCTCTPGWVGQYCNKTCEQGYYGNKCETNCTCLNGATCDPVSGNCTCATGYKEQRCESHCSSGWYGNDCAVKCTCLNGATCDHVNGTCNCRPGWTGSICNQPCPEGTYGYRCAQTCVHCKYGATCDHVTGGCKCLPGYKGKRCEHLCQEGNFGQECQGICSCETNATCSHINGSCTCTSGYTGNHCELLIEKNSVTYDSYEKNTGDINPLLPILATCLPVILIASVAFGFLIYRKKKKPNSKRTTGPRPAEPVYASAEGQRTGSDYDESDAVQEEETAHVYQTPTSRTLKAVNINDVSYVAMGPTQYMDLSNQRNLDPNNYQSLSSQTKNKKTKTNATYDVPVKKKNTNIYEEIQLDQDNSEQCHYYKGLELPSTSLQGDVGSVAMETENAEQNEGDLVENEYDAPKRELIKKGISDGQTSGYATPD